MKQLIVLLGLACINSGFSQDTIRHEVALTYSNNGQIAATVDDFYFRPRVEDNLRQSVFKINAAYSFHSRKGTEYGIQLGFGQRKEHYPRPNPLQNDTARQQYYSLMPFALKTWEFNRFGIATGGGIPLSLISEYRYAGGDYLSLPFRATFDGGFAVGLNSITQLRFSLTGRFSLTASVQFGWMYADLGGKFVQKPDDPDYQAVWIVEDERVYRKTFFTQPEFFFGAGFRL